MKPKVFFTKKITPEKVVELYDALSHASVRRASERHNAFPA